MIPVRIPQWVSRRLARSLKPGPRIPKGQRTFGSSSRQSGRLGVKSHGHGGVPVALKTVIHRTIEDIPAADWDAIVGCSGLMRSHAYLRATESCGLDGCEYFYPVIYDQGGQIVAHACVYTIDTDLSQLLPKILQVVPRVLRTVWKRFLNFKVTECASPMSTSHSISLSPKTDPAGQIAALARAFDRIARSQGSALIVVRDFLQEDRLFFDEFLRRDFNLVSNMPLARVRVRWNSYEEYLSSMRARYRKDVKRRLKLASEAGQTVRILDSFGDDAALWAAQAKTVQQRTKGFKREVLPGNYYASMDSYLGEQSVLVVTERMQRPVAHGMVLLDDSIAIATYFGRDEGPASQEWFQLANEVIRIGIERGVKFINLGLGSYDAKSNIGADVEPLYVYSKSTIAPINWLMRLVPRTMECSVDRAKQVFRA